MRYEKDEFISELRRGDEQARRSVSEAREEQLFKEVAHLKTVASLAWDAVSCLNATQKSYLLKIWAGHAESRSNPDLRDLIEALRKPPSNPIS